MQNPHKRELEILMTSSTVRFLVKITHRYGGLLVTNPGVMRQALLRDVTVTEYFRRPIRMERNRHYSAKLHAIVGFSSLGNKIK